MRLIPILVISLLMVVTGCIPKEPTRTVRPEVLEGPWEVRHVSSESGHEYRYLFADGPSEDAPVLVLLPGGFFDNRIWMYADQLAEHFTLVSPDWPDNSLFYTGKVQDFGDITVDFLNALELDDIYLVGVSMGTYAAVDVASRLKDQVKVRALVLASTVMFGVTEEEVEKRTKYGRLALKLGPHKFRALVEWQVGRTELPPGPGSIRQDQIFWVRPYTYYFQIFSMMVNQGKKKQDTKSIDCPVFFIHGTEDETMPVETARSNPSVFSEAKWKEFEGLTHSMVFSHGPLMAETIMEFFEKHHFLGGSADQL